MTRGDRIRGVLGVHANLRVDAAAVGDGDDLYALGLTSHASVRVMLALEDAFDVEIPDRLLVKESFGSVAAIDAMLDQISVAV